ncbi:hypothetical protein [Nocardiopsis lambiniae]|uniref:Uncharacterized protein n=1 Tax=Nocardiopsis lambiniae TaxID=3075539 RepID=A0ABU2MAX7_9ACTN|nr:hypothetical protein [Nocardiopsis sp. DSM 44743]MDT0329820.1 hypothetical protein [Nocardiopsis sp. DSM 44743]
MWRAAPWRADPLDGSGLGQDTGHDHPGQRRATFERDGGSFTDHRIGSRWYISGRAVDGEPAGGALTPVDQVDTFRFAW